MHDIEHPPLAPNPLATQPPAPVATPRRAPPVPGQPVVGPGGNPQAAAELGAQFAEGSSPPTAPTAETRGAPPPITGTKEAEKQRLAEELNGMTEAEKAARKAEALERAKLFSKDSVEMATKDMDPAKAAEQRITNARKLLIELEATGMTPEEARSQAGMDERILKEVDRQQKMVDGLARQQSQLTPAQMEAAQVAAEQRARNKEHPGSVTKAEADAVLAKLGGQAALDGMPPETRLLVMGFNPDDIADHFTARDKDADVMRDPKNPGNAANNTDFRGEGKLADEKNPDGSVKSTLVGGDVNESGTVRRPMTPEEADRAIDMNAVLDQSWHEGNRFGKIIPETAVGNYQTGVDTYRDDKGKAGGGTRAPALTGDIGELANTAMSPARDGTAPTGAQQVQAAGLDYKGAPYVNEGARPGETQIKPDLKVHRVEGEITKDLEDNAEVQVGKGIMARAQTRSQELEAATAAHVAAGGAATDASAPAVPKMLRRDDSKDEMPGMAARSRETNIDPRTGLGYSTTERLDMETVPNQERKMSAAMSFKDLPGTTVTRADQPGEVGMTLDPATGKFIPANPATQADYERLRREAEQREAEIAAAKAKAP